MMALVVLLASCSKEETPGQVYGDESLVTFTLSTGDLATKTAGDGTTAKQLYYAVYDAAGEMVEQISANAEPAAMSNSGAQVEMSLLNGQTYSIIFWAQNKTAPCTIDWTAKTMTYEPKLANQEVYDAFFAYVAPFKVTGAKTEKVELKRPFAQLNIGTTDGDLAELAKYHQKGDYTQAKVTVEKLPNVLNLVTGEATGEVTAVYDYANIDLLKDETFPVAGYKQYLAMNYVLQSTNQTVAVTLDVKSEQDHTVSRTFGNVPVKRNYKTNIYGDLYASTFAYDVEVAPDFNDTHYQTLSGVINLEEDMEITRPLVIAAGDEAIINLNGHKIVNKNESNGDVFTVRGKLTIKGDGEINAAWCAIYARGEAEVNIYGGTFIGSNTTDGGCETIYARDNAKVNIYGGTYEAISPYGGKIWVLNLKDSGSPAINVYGGEFKKFNPAIPGTEPVDWNTAHANGFVADGYKSTQVGENYIVTEESVDVVTQLKV